MAEHYLDNNRLEEVIKGYQEDPETYGNELAELFDKLIFNIYRTFKFTIDYEDARQNCLVLILNVLKNFDSSKSSAFNYFTTIITNEFRRNYTRQKKYDLKIETYKQIQEDKLES